MELLRVGRETVAGFYDLIQVNGATLPVSVEGMAGIAEVPPRYRIQGGELLLHPSGTFGLELNAVDDRGQTTWGRVLVAGGRWQFLPGEPDEAGGGLLLASPRGNTTSARVSLRSLVHRAGIPGAPRGASDLNWTYARRAAHPPAGNWSRAGSEPAKGLSLGFNPRGDGWS
jgi:hypothetical protein